ncbi:MAG: hypothetical protein ABIR96_05120 [Bdellovibrionota bacterium]
MKIWDLLIVITALSASAHALDLGHVDTVPVAPEKFDSSSTVLDIFSDEERFCRLDLRGLKTEPLDDTPEAEAWEELTREPGIIYPSMLKDAEDRKATNHGALTALNSLATKLKKVPGGMGALIHDYQEILGLNAYSSSGEVGASNAGIAKHFETVLKNDPKLQDAARAFYKDIRARDVERVAWNNIRSDEQFPLKDRASLADHAHDIKNPNLTDGWAWDLALKYSERDPVLAMRIIGLCGHDDTAQGSYYTAIPPEQQESVVKEEQSAMLLETRLLEAKIARNLALIDELKLKLAHPGGNEQQDIEDKFSLANLQEQVISDKTSLATNESTPNESPLGRELICPPKSSSFYYPGGLGAKVDIPQDLKDRIIKTQENASARPRGRQPGALLPAKYYHIMGSAAVACELVAKGHSPALVKSLSRLLGWAYRAQRLNAEQCRNAFDDAKAEDKERLVKLRNKASFGKKKDAQNTKGDEASPEEHRSENQNVSQDAVQLMKASALGGQKIGWGDFSVQIPQTNFRVKVPAWLEKFDYVKNFSKPKDWSNERFAAAKLKMESWFADWAWTTEQHAVGGDFGAEMCSPENVKAAKARAAIKR